VTQRTSFAKMQRDRDKQAKAAAKRDRRLERQAVPDGAAAPVIDLDDTSAELSAAELLQLVETIHGEFEAGVIDFETFEEKKTALLSRLSVD
jgi:hypothetical protein